MTDHVHYIAGHWLEGVGSSLESLDPATGDAVWHGREATSEEVDAAVAAARDAFDAWADTPVEKRIAYAEAFADYVKNHRNDFAEAISLETGKPTWESLTEVAAVIAKTPMSIAAFKERRATAERDVGGARGVTRFKPYGAAAVFGPFNFPGHVPNGHIVPALLAGDTVVFKPSEKTPMVGQRMVEAWQAVGLPAGVVNLLQGGRDTGVALGGHRGIDALLFTGGAGAGLALRKALVDRPEVILALEMGGNNPLVVHEVNDIDAAAYLTIQSAYLTAGQRCTCAGRLIVPEGGAGDTLIDRLVAMARTLRVGRFSERPEPFMGPVISEQSAEHVLLAQADLIRRGGRALLESQPLGARRAMLSPGLIDVTPITDRADQEIFGPVLQLIRVKDFDAAIAEANATSYGLVAGLFSDNRELFDRFLRKVRAGLINWNRQTTGASGWLPFGGVGRSGNHRPTGYYAADYCSYPVASLELDRVAMPDQRLPGVSV
jgi:succinylglutamic semialdehyde dehydrogenase